MRTGWGTMTTMRRTNDKQNSRGKEVHRGKKKTKGKVEIGNEYK